MYRKFVSTSCNLLGGEELDGKIQEKIGQVLQLQGISVKTVPFLLASCISLIALYIKSVDTNLTEFYNRAIGSASINGVDAPVRIHAFWVCVLIFVISFVAGNYIVNRIRTYILEKNQQQSLEFECTLFFEFSILLLIDRIIFLISFARDRTVQMPVMLPVIFAIVCLHLFINTSRHGMS